MFDSFKVEGSADFLIRHLKEGTTESWDKAREQRDPFTETREYQWNKEDNTFQVTSRSRVHSRHKVNIDKIHCSCFAYKKAEYPDKICVHLRDVARHFRINELLRSPLYLVVSTHERVPFRELSNAKTTMTSQWIAEAGNNWLVSRKHDGVRFLWKTSGEILTRNGLRLLHVERALRDAQKTVPREPLEGELTLVTREQKRTTSEQVQRHVLHATRPLKYNEDFELYVLDVFEGQGGFNERISRAKAEAHKCGVAFIDQQPLPSTIAQLHNLLQTEISEGGEGLVLQHGSETYQAGKRSSSKCSLKLKHDARFE